jgi:hypothetical protein
MAVRVVLNVTFSDETYFHFGGYISKLSYFGPSNHCIQREVVWRALSSIGIFGPVLISGTVTSDVHLSLLSEEFTPFQMRYGIPVNSALFHQDSARSHASEVLTSSLRDVLEKTVQT